MLSTLFLVLAFALAIIIHEVAHAWMSDRLGDPTARLMGRLSLNPLVHYDPVGTTLLLITAFLWRIGAPVFPFGWAKPVGFDPYNLKNPRRDSALISLAGPGANLILAMLAAFLLRLNMNPFSPLTFLNQFFYPFIILNISLAIFNLIPVHPLDGGKILVGLLPRKEAYSVDSFLNRFGTLILIFLIFPIFGGIAPISLFVSPVITFLLHFLIPGNSLF